MQVTCLGHAGLHVQTSGGTISCDPWKNPAYFGSWFVFPDNSGLDWDRYGQVDFLYVSHLHRDHFDPALLNEHVSRQATVLLPDLWDASRCRRRAGRLTAVLVTLGEITDRNREAVLALRVAPEQERFVGSVPSALADAAEYPHAKPWYRAVCAGDEPVGFVMVSWNVEPQPPEIIGPWFLWKLLIDERHQGRGYGLEVVRQIAELVRAEGAMELLTSYVPEDGGPAGFYQRLGFVPTGQLDGNGEVIVRLVLP